MMMSYSADYLQSALWLVVRTLFGAPALVSIATYVLTALALYTIARRRGLKNPWLAWIPVADCWLIGSLSDQYQYVVNGASKSKRKLLLGFRILTSVLCAVLLGLVVKLCFHAFGGVMRGTLPDMLLAQILHQAAGLMTVALPLLGVSIAFAVLRYMALYDIYKSLDPANCTLFLVLSILFGITEPFFLFFSRNKDDGMPPRKQAADQPAPGSNDWVDVQADEL